MVWDKVKINNQYGEIVEAQAPIIISASRSTDIPAFYSDWLVERIKSGYVKWTNPFNGKPVYISFNKARLVVFWSKNPAPIIKYLDFFDKTINNYYFQYTLNDYEKDRLELGVPKLEERIETFLRISERVGKERVIWRFDPLILTDKIDVNTLLEKVEKIGNRLKGYTDKLVFSFADIGHYQKVKNNLIRSNIKFKEFGVEDMKEFSRGLSEINNRNWKLNLATCCEEIDLDEFGIQHNKCIDDDLIIKQFFRDKDLMDFLGVDVIPPNLLSNDYSIVKKKNNKDKGQRAKCGCIVSKDIGEYNTCPHLCEYCYANSSKEIALRNWEKHKNKPNLETIKGE